MRILKTNTAVRIVVGPFLDATDGVTPKTALTVTNCTCELFHEHDDGSAPTRSALTLSASGGSNDMVHITNDVGGYYDLELAAADVNFLGRARLSIIDTDVHLPVFEEILVVAANVYDALMGTDYLKTDAVEVNGTAQTARDLGASVLVGDKTGFSLAADQAVNVTKWNGAAVAAPNVAGVPKVDISHLGGTAQGTPSGSELDQITNGNNYAKFAAFYAGLAAAKGLASLSGLDWNAATVTMDRISGAWPAGMTLNIWTESFALMNASSGNPSKFKIGTYTEPGGFTKIGSPLLDDSQILYVTWEGGSPVPSNEILLRMTVVDNGDDGHGTQVYTMRIPKGSVCCYFKLDGTPQYWEGGELPSFYQDVYSRLGAPAGASIAADIAAINSLGSGSTPNTITVDDGTNPVEGAAVWVTSDESGTSVVAGTLYTDTLGRVTFMLDPGTYYVWVQSSRINKTNPTTLIVV